LFTNSTKFGMYPYQRLFSSGVILTIHFTWRVCAHYLVMLPETKYDQNGAISHDRQQKSKVEDNINYPSAKHMS